MPVPADYGAVNDYGFDWGPMRVTRMVHVAGRGRYLSIRTEKAGVMEVYIPEKGTKIVVRPISDARVVLAT